MLVPNDNWTLCTMNEKYELCDTYPRQIYVPKEATTLMLISSSRFRSKGRLPALTYLHNNKVSREKGGESLLSTNPLPSINRRPSAVAANRCRDSVHAV